MTHAASAPGGPDQVSRAQRRGVLGRRRRADTQACGEFGGAARLAEGSQRRRPGPPQNPSQISVPAGAVWRTGRPRRVDQRAAARFRWADREQWRAGPNGGRHDLQAVSIEAQLARPARPFQRPARPARATGHARPDPRAAYRTPLPGRSPPAPESARPRRRGTMPESWASTVPRRPHGNRAARPAPCSAPPDRRRPVLAATMAAARPSATRRPAASAAPAAASSARWRVPRPGRSLPGPGTLASTRVGVSGPAAAGQ